MNRTNRAFGIAVLALLLLGCGNSVVEPGQEITELPRDLGDAEKSLITADNAFGLELFRQVALSDAEGNIFISPLSVAMALGMTYNGAAGGTEAAMRTTLQLGELERADVNASYRSLIALLQELDPRVQMTIANSIWYREGFSVREDFLGVNRDFFDAEVTALDFDDPGAPETIDAWVDSKTEGRITEIAPKPIPSELVMFLIDAIYFKGRWTEEFDPERTHEASFTLPDGSAIEVPMMMSTGELEIGHTVTADGIEVADLPYGGKAFSMMILLPPRDGDVAGLIASLDDGRWTDIAASVEARSMQVWMPKFTLEYELEMREALSALGMGVAFDPDEADFSGIADAQLYISRVKHKTFVEVNEEGTEAAAVTSVEIGVTSMPPTFIVDRPFVFAIRERFSGTVLFLGRVMDPS